MLNEAGQPCAFILASGRYGTLYIGVTSNLLGHTWQHREKAFPVFAAKYAVDHLVHFELFGEMAPAILREKQLKRWHRQWKITLISEMNPEARALAVGLGLPPLGLIVRSNGS